jgi:anti-anti-sigma regulatory factor
MFSIRIDKKNNLITVSFKGYFDAQQGVQLCQRLTDAIQKVKKGFSVITDLSSVDFISMDSVVFIGKAMTICNKNGVSRVIRVIPDPSKDIGFNIMSDFHYSKNVKIRICKNHEEARKFITLSRKSGLMNEILTFISVIKNKLMIICFNGKFQITIISAIFFILVIARVVIQEFGVSLGYIYVGLVCLAGFWFGIRGGLVTAVIASLIFLAELKLYPYSPAKLAVIKGMLLRFLYIF